MDALGRTEWGRLVGDAQSGAPSPDWALIPQPIKNYLFFAPGRTASSRRVPSLLLRALLLAVSRLSTNFTTTPGQFGVLPHCPYLDVLSRWSVRF